MERNRFIYYKKECPNFKLRVMQKTFYDLVQLLSSNDYITIEEWSKNASKSLLSAEPFLVV